MGKPKKASHLKQWGISVADPEPSHQKYYESIMTLGNGYLGVRGSREEERLGPNSEPLTLIAEVYDDPGDYDKPERLAPAPNWLSITFDDGSGHPAAAMLNDLRHVDFKRGTLHRHVMLGDPSDRHISIFSGRLVSQARPHIAAIRYEIWSENHSGRVKLTSYLDGTATYADGKVQTAEISKSREGNTISLVVRTNQSQVDIAEAARHTLRCGKAEVDASVRVKRSAGRIGLEFEFEVEPHKAYVLEKIVAIDTSFREPDPLASVLRQVREAPDFTALEKEQAAAWADYWKDSDIKIVGDGFVQAMARLWVFHLLQAASKNNVLMGLSASVPAKTLSGPGYNGHIFWDTEIYMLPFYSQQYPEIAESLLRYRYDRLETARQYAVSEGRRGARFPWESAASGLETTPKWCATGWREIHVIADVAFGVWQHYLTTGDEEFLLGPGLELFLETARYWSTRAEKVKLPDGYRYEMTEVIGPDENHDPVDNSVYTNAMARWNIRKAMELLDRVERERPGRHKDIVRKLGISKRELEKWADVADNLKISFDPATGLYEEFDGYFDLEGEERCIKQADVLLMLFLLPELRTTEIFRKNFDVYYPVTLHGSSLSPAVHVLFSLDVGYRDHAYRYEVQTCSIDGTRRDGATDAGLHAASLGGGWSSIVAGFGGVRVMPDHLRVAPELPDKWKMLEFSIQYQGQRLRFHVEHGLLRITADPGGRPAPLEVKGRRTMVRPGETMEVTE